ncbi:MAG: sugar transferase [Lachnospiraceae bacterium]|jgi:exopolysaccharide biosynthesis polyprenyl glycosylphosphotransferase|nr:sugar transferase [Lachnospiraceae bacterium]MCI8871281.1 sugar transferase [Lachnospiraceae bacterium]GFI33292.1 UDP-N-acetylgalactosamine-undecaprenyl-phosphate N-acetylgalactosaminephosphotransferase [Lachnospiraceae bacterium]
MRKREQYKHLLNLTANYMMLAMETAMFAYTWYVIYYPMLAKANRPWHRGNWAVIGIYALIMYFFTRTFGGYRIGYLRITDICLSQILSIFCANGVGYLQVCLVANDYMPVHPLAMLTFAQYLVILPGVYLVRFIYTRLYPPRKMIVIYGEHSPDDLIEKINSRKDKYNVCATASVYLGYEELYTRILEYEAVVLCDLPTSMRNPILKFCFDQNKRTYITPKISDIILTGTESIHLFDSPLMLSRNHGLTIEQRFIKRAMDIVLSLIAIVISSPVLLFIGLCIKLYDKGPVFYTQERLTRGGEVFQIIKFRSMRMDSERDGAQLARKDDDRITPVGRIIRQTHFDELPQIFNILKGEMSFVGPRPERESIAREYETVIPEFSFRLKVKAGLTGYAQIYGKYNTTPYDKLKLDLTYIENYSFWMDLKLMLMTFKIIFQKENTEGIDKQQRTAVK